MLSKVKSNILPFIIIGLVLGLVIGKASKLRGIGTINDWLNFASINTYFPDSGQRLFFNYFFPEVLTFFLVVMLALAGFHRLVRGDREKFPDDRNSNSQALDNFGSLLAIAWLGLLIGISVPVMIYEHPLRGLEFLANAAFPLVFLIEVQVCTAFISGTGLNVVYNLAGGHSRTAVSVRAEGLVLVLAAGALMTFMEHHYQAIDWFVRWVARTI